MSTSTVSRHVSILAASCCVLIVSAQIAAQEEPPAVEEQDAVTEGERCISSRPVRRTEVLDDQNILFYMRGTVIYLNHLPKPCKRLADEGRFMYRTTVARICRADAIQVLKDSGFGMSAGRSCKLGSFYAITQEDVDKIKTPLEVEPKPVDPAEPEEPGTDDSQDTDDATEAEETD